MRSMTLIPLLALVVLSGCYTQHRTMKEEMLLSDGIWLERAKPDEIRSICNNAISRHHAYHHDAFIHLRVNGDKSSVPLLVRALEWYPATEREGGYAYSCTTGHCLAALKALTGEDLGYKPEAWANWWKETGKALPEDHFRPRRYRTRSFPEPPGDANRSTGQED